MFFNRRITALNVESKFTLKIGHDRNMNLIIKELSVKADNVDDLILQVKDALEQFNDMKVEQMLGE
tara:strand:- start:194 stop:391 length:198 start_codon:yes stop_codon:yes gene_type:complete